MILVQNINLTEGIVNLIWFQSYIFGLQVMEKPRSLDG